ncbi:nitronate monooxygenase [Streptomyces sp. JH14]|uniref:NAD(P)H-dependent flavin oxidoreductase n=1 Tax=Streptomyces sp. JH14 TaxID=2793630 RepID=UPI0023F99760|nr:nitronate monooxygenase [Streptomyces sp. JH14]MDF6043369.1 nitronate monooxygenase [Streptomyces sp. JH14]
MATAPPSLRTRFTELVGCTVPVQLAGMGWVSGVDLSAAVSQAGGLGMVAFPMATPEALTGLLEDVRRRTTRPVGINFLLPLLQDHACIDIAAERMSVVEFLWATPSPRLVARVQAGGALAAWQVGSVEEAREAAYAGCDFVVVQGVEAGGHVRGSRALLPLLGEVVEHVDIPVVAAGGIATARSVAAVLAAGADGARIGTRFIATTETLLAGAAVPVPASSPFCPTRTTTGQVDAMPLYAGEAVGAVTRIEPAADVIRELATGAVALLNRALSGPDPD